VDSSIEICYSTCNGSISTPFSDLTFALENEYKASLPYQSSEIEFLLLSLKHNLKLIGGDNQLFRRNFAAIILRPAYCLEFNITNCLQMGIDPKIITPPYSVLIYVSSSLLIQNLTFQGIPLCALADTYNSSSDCFKRSLLPLSNTTNNYDALFNLEAIFDAPFDIELHSPRLTIIQSKFVRIIGLGISAPESQLYNTFASLISIRNPWGAFIQIAESIFLGGFYTAGFFNHAPDLPKLYSDSLTIFGRKDPSPKYEILP
jgi:hypothetical protein